MDFLKDLNIDKVRNLAEDAFNQAKPKTDLEAKIYEVLSHKNWGTSSTIMNEIARDTFDYDKFAVITTLMWEAMENQRPAAWRVVFKGLSLLEHLIKNGSERCVDDARNHGHTLRSLHQFNYYEGTIDRGLGVREKSKQLVEILSDDERIREERQKAKQLREKFGGNLGGTGSSGGGGKYAGYGNDNWNSGGGGGGGYGDGGIGSSKFSGGGGGGSRYDEDHIGGGGGYSGRYDNDESAAPTPAPTFASLPDDPLSNKKGKKKKKKKEEAASAAPEVDLFSFDAPAAPEPTNDDSFGDFAGAGNTTSTTTTSTVVDPFAAAPATGTQPATQSFDAFGGTANTAATNNAQSFDAFGAPPGNIMGGNNMMQQQQQPMMMGGGSGMMQQPMGGTMMQQQQQPMVGTMMQQPSSASAPQAAAPDDDFGDFAAASAPVATSRDPMSKLISLDGLSKNTTKEDKLNQPIIANAAAATFLQEKDQIKETVQKSVKGSTMGFEGIDGLVKNQQTTMGGMGQMNNMMGAMSMGSNPSVMGGTGGSSASAIGMLDPSAFSNMQGPAQPNTQFQQPNQQFQGMSQPQMMNQMGGANSNNNNMMYNNNMQGGSGMQQNPGMMGQGMMNPQGMGGMGNQAMNQMGMNGMPGNMMNQQQGMNNFGGMGQQPNGSMGGFR